MGEKQSNSTKNIQLLQNKGENRLKIWRGHKIRKDIILPILEAKLKHDKVNEINEKHITQLEIEKKKH